MNTDFFLWRSNSWAQKQTVCVHTLYGQEIGITTKEQVPTSKRMASDKVFWVCLKEDEEMELFLCMGSLSLLLFLLALAEKTMNGSQWCDTFFAGPLSYALNLTHYVPQLK